MKNIKTVFILVLSLILLFAVSCDTESKTGVKNNPPENDTEITGGGTGTGGDGTETPTSPSEPETTETIEIEAKDFSTDTELSELFGTYRDDRVYPGYSDTKLEYDKGTKTTIKGVWHNDDKPGRGSTLNFTIEKWKKTTKGGNPIKLEGECPDYSGKGKYTVIYDYASGTLSGKYTHSDGTWSFNGKK